MASSMTSTSQPVFVDPHHVDADPDATYHPVADPDPIRIYLGQNGNLIDFFQ
jgi:hypothetical protein